MSLMELEWIEKLFTPEQTREIMSKLMDECDFVAAGVRGALPARDRIAPSPCFAHLGYEER